MIAVGGHYLEPLPGLLVRAACPFGGGIGGSHQELCGALAGGVIVLGALYGRETSAVDDTRVQALAAEFRERFQAHFKDTRCQSIRDRWRDPAQGCLPVVLEAVELLLDLLPQSEADVTL